MFQPVICSSNFTDQEALLHFKSTMEVDSTSTIKGGNWTVEVNFCEWIGVVCSSRKQRVTDLALSHMGLRGRLSPYLGNLSLLASLDLRNNSFYGMIPIEIGHLRRLTELILESNQFEGNIPPILAQCQSLEVMSLAMNRLTGGIPREFDTFPKLQQLNLSSNDLRGQIPSFLGNISTLQVIGLANASFIGSIPSALFNRSLRWVNLSDNYLSGSLPSDICYRWPNIQILSLRKNQFSGPLPETLTQCKELIILWLSFNSFQGREIPSEIGNLVNLKRMRLAYNSLIGEVSQEVFNISSLRVLNLVNNSISGSLPSGRDLSLPNLECLFLGINSFSGNIPQYLSNFSNLIIFDVSDNQLSGPIHTGLGNLKNLEYFSIGFNHLTGDTYGSELGFLSALSNCLSLKLLALEGNPLRGSIPESIKNFSSSLQILTAHNCQIRGCIPEEISFLKRLTWLDLGNNALDCNIPSSIGGLERLQRLYLDNNHLEGPIPDEICNLTGLGELVLGQNRISGSIPNCIGNLSNLQKFLISSNNMTLVIPFSLWGLQELIFLNLSLNSFNGGLPLEIGKMRAIESIDLSWNRLTGAIPSSIQEFESLASLNLSRNSFQGSIPQSIGHLKGLDFLDLSYNELSGTIPKSMEGLAYLKNLNLSFNKLSGEIPNGGPFGNFSALSFIGNEALCVSMENLPRIEHPMISYRELCLATNNFSESNLLGVGSFSSVYKGTLANGTDIAVKVLNLYIEGALKSFDAECDVFRMIRHRNLVKVISTCTNANLRALVLQYVPCGSLEKWLYSNNYNLDLHQRMKILVDVAMAIQYLHHGQSEPIVHCDLKPSNILLNEDLVAQVCDFGIAKILAENKLDTQTRTLGTIGYIAPEYGSEGKVSTKGDVYSFGVLLLEVITGKKPTSEMFNADISLRQWVGASIPERVLDIVDSKI
ncbi:hypothetical protein EUGRSUZ_C03748, partial [Eucalyptus grandis]